MSVSRRMTDSASPGGSSRRRLGGGRECVGGAVQPLARPEQRPPGAARAGAKVPELVAPQAQRLFGLAEVARGDEVGAGQPLLLVLQARRPAVQRKRLVAPALVPEDAGQRAVVAGVEPPVAQRPPQKSYRLRVLAGVAPQLLVELRPEHGVSRL